MSFLVLTRRPALADLLRWLGPATERCTVVTSAVRAGDRHLIEAFRHVEQVPDYSDSRVGHRATELAARHGVERIAVMNEVDVVRAAIIRQLLGIAGQDLPSAIAFRDKHIMKSVAHTYCVPVAAMRRVSSNRQGRAAAFTLSYPVIVKPLDGGGSVGVHRVACEDEWPTMSEQRDFLVEKWIEPAAFLVVDGLMRAGEITQRVVLRMMHGGLNHITEGTPVAGYSIPEDTDISQRVTDFAARVLRALPTVPHETAFHLELFQEPDGRLVLGEVASRPGGAGHAPAFALATGIDLYQATVVGQLGLGSSTAGFQRRAESAFADYPKGHGTLLRHPVTLTHPNLSSYIADVSVGDTAAGERWVGDSAGRILLAAPVGTDLSARLPEAMAEYVAGTEWSGVDRVPAFD
jgi:biotin carboxylase